MSIKDDQPPLIGMDDVVAPSAAAADATPARDGDVAAPPRLRRVDRKQHRIISCALDDLLPDDHRARLVWRVVESLPLAAFEDAVAARGSAPGRAATDPRILIALWLYAAIDGVGGGREIDRLCQCHDAYRWLAGDVSLNYHTINDFRVAHETALDGLFTHVIAVLVKQGLIDVTQLTQDGIRVRASAGGNTFRREASLEKLLEEAKAHVAALKAQNDPALSAQQNAKRLADAQDRESRVAAALAQLPALRAEQEAACKRAGREMKETRVSTTDADARVMKMSDGGFRPAYNVQLAVETTGRAIVGVEVTNDGGDRGLDAPMREQVQERSSGEVKEHLLDGGYATHEAVDQAATDGVTFIAPVKKPSKEGIDPHAPKPGDSEAVAAWRQRMDTDEAKALYKLRGATVETVNADLSQHRGLRQFPVRGSPKVRCVALWLALAYNILMFGPKLIAAACEKC